MSSPQEKLRLIEQNLDNAFKILKECLLCPRKCRVNRLRGEKGFCKSSKELYIFSFGPHFKEEDVLVGKFGSGAIFFSGCNLGCIYCQNYTISHLYEGYEIDTEELAEIMLSLQDIHCHNINLVTPTHFMPQIMMALYHALKKGLNIPVVYNSSGYEAISSLKLLEGIIDIYMPDVKYWDSFNSERFSKARDYPLVVKEALKLMHKQVGGLLIDDSGIAYKGLLIRHLILPNGLSDSKAIVKFIATEISKNSYINIMNQYRPCFEAFKYAELSRPITNGEFRSVIEFAKGCDLKRGF